MRRYTVTYHAFWACLGLILIFTSCATSEDQERFVIEDVEGNTVIMTTGLRVKMLGIKDGSLQAEQFVRNNCTGETVLLIADCGGEEIEVTDDEVHRYIIRTDNGNTCLNSQIIDQYRRDVYDPAYVTDSLATYEKIVRRDKSLTEIPDLALFMKQRTFLLSTPEGIGTGFFINEDGLAVTNNHVMAEPDGEIYLYSEDPDASKVYACERRPIGDVIYTDSVLDITIFTVALKDNERVPYFTLADRHARVGDYCATLGNPYGLTASFSGGGEVSAYRRDPYAMRDSVMLMQYTTPTNAGNSGGAVCLRNGLVYAVHEMGDKRMQNINYGIDILQVRKVLDKKGMKYGGK